MPTPPVQSFEPESLAAGTTWTWRKSISDYPSADGWSLHYRVVISDSDLTIDATPDPVGSDSYLVKVAPSVTQNIAPTVENQRYPWIAYVTNTDGDVFVIDKGFFYVLPNPLTETAAMGMTHAQRALTAVNAALEGRITKDFESYAIAGRSITKIHIRDLMRLKKHYEYIVWREQHPGSPMPSIQVAFTYPLAYPYTSIARAWPWVFGGSM